MDYLTMDFGGTLVKYSVMDENTTVYCSGEAPAPLGSVKTITDFIRKIYFQYSQRYDLKGIAISMPGMIDSRQGILITAGAYYVYDVDMPWELRDLPIPVSVENDGKCGALAEAWRGNLKDCRDGIVLILGTGLAGGVIKDGRIHKGKALTAGEFSFLIMDNTQSYKSTGMYRCGVASLLYRACLAKGIDVTKSPSYGRLLDLCGDDQQLTEWDHRPEYAQGMNGYQFFQLLEQGDSDISRLYQQFTYDIARVLFNLQCVYAPEKILVGGGISRQERLIPDIRSQYQVLENYFADNIQMHCYIEACHFGNEANQYGALYHFLHLHETGD